MGDSSSAGKIAPVLDATGVPHLQNLCFNAFYRELVFKASPGTVTFVRQCIHQQLMGSMRKKIRETCLILLNNCYRGNHPDSNKTPDVCVAMDCLLDDSLLNLEIHVPSSFCLEMFPKLLSIIANRSPKLSELTITFHGNNKIIASAADQLLVSKPADQDCLLNCLTELTLRYCKHHYTDGSDVNDEPPKLDVLFVTVAELCPILTHLLVCGFCNKIKNRSLLSLITGTFSYTLFPTDDQRWAEDAVLGGLQVPTVFLSPLCFTLKSMGLIGRCWRKRCDCGSRSKNVISASTVAFVFRHFPALEAMPPPKSKLSAIKILYSKLLNSQKTETQRLFEEHCREIRKDLDLSSLHLLSGPVALTHLRFDRVSIRYDLRAIGTVCPNLSEVTFTGELSDQVTTGLLATLGCGEELESILKAWPKLNTITLLFFGPDSPFLKTVLNAFAPYLRRLYLNRCDRVDLTHLSLCTHLEHLSVISSTFSSSEASDPAQWNGGNTFLPSLKSLYSNVCLGIWAPLFERKSTLVDVHLHCCHIGTSVYDNEKLEWGQLAKFWPNLESFRLGQATGLTMSILSNIIPQLEQLRRIELPSSIMTEEPDELTSTLTIDDSKRKTQIKIGRYPTSNSSEPCPY